MVRIGIGVLPSNGVVTVAGPGAVWETDGLTVGFSEPGALIIKDGGTVFSAAASVGNDMSPNGSATVEGKNSRWDIGTSLNVGGTGNPGILDIMDGGSVTVGEAVIFDGGVVTISGIDASWEISGSLEIGRGSGGNGTLAVNNSGRTASAYTILGTFGSGTGTLNLDGVAGARGVLETGYVERGPGSADFTFDGGILRATSDQTDFLRSFNAGDVTIDAGGAFIDSNGYDIGIGAPLDGTGGLTKLGAGTLTLTGVSSYAGPTAILGGTLLVNGTLGGTFDVFSGGRLGGSGTVGDTTVASGGVVAPGNSIGTLNVADGIAFAPGSIYEVEVDPAGSASDLIHATGAATLAGGSVIHIGAAGAYRPDSTYTILTADGGVTGVFGDVASNFAFLDPTLGYDPNNVYLNLVRNEVSFSVIGETSNQRHTGEGIESTGAGSLVHDAVVGLDADQARAAFDQMSGEIHASARGMMLEDSRFLREAAAARVRAAFAGAGGAGLPVMAFGPAKQQAAGADAFAPAAADTGRAAMWMRGFGSWGEREGDGNAADFGRSTGGVFIGADAPVGDWRAGLLAGYSRSSFDVDERGSSGEADSYHLGLYGGTQWGALGLRLGAAYSWHDIGTDRSVVVPGLADSLSADYDAATAQTFGELGYRIGREALAFEPFVSLAYVNLHTDGFTEDGGAAALAGDSADTDAAFTTLGLRASAGFTPGEIEVKARGMLGWRHAFGDVTPLSTHAFAGGDIFTIAGVPIAQDAAILEAGLDFQVTETTTLGLSYSGQIAGGSSDHGARATLTVKF
ncbi:autotransporter domain-containing protein [Inquilinus sp. CAU 1745]|uniref:autotransporter outer membrane beta-barrel domain-containing protein n=1 Tax=Inquilinus sp. CAU 1745 TaxID=3140369 RepID=UPI00325B4D16